MAGRAVSSAEPSLTCSRCGADNYPFATFCINCGEPLDDEWDPYFSASVAVSATAMEAPLLRGRSSTATRSGRNLARWETAIGVLLLFLAVGYALYYWQESEARSAAFRSGLAAEQQRDWDRAVAGFARAKDRRDAEQKEQEARRKVVERNRLYYEGLTSSDRKDWSAAISAFEQVLAIQPSYRDSTTRLSNALDGAYKQGLAGLIYLVNSGAAQGLYLRDHLGRASRLPGSDGKSLLRAASSDGAAFVYDRPSVEASYYDPLLNYNSTLPDYLSSSRTDRVPVLVRLGPGADLSTQVLHGLEGSGKGTFTQNGLWWYKSLPAANSAEQVYYYDLSARKVISVSSGGEGRQVWALDPPRSRVVLGEEKLVPSSGITETRLYVAGAAGQEPRLLGVWPRTRISQVAISPDGRWLLQMISAEGIRPGHSAWAVPFNTGDRDREGSPLPGSELITLSRRELDGGVRLNAAFIPSKGYSSMVMVSLNGPDGESLFVCVPGEGKSTWVASMRPTGAYRRDLSAFSHDGTYLATRRQVGDSATLEVIGTRAGSGTAAARVKLQAFDEQSVRVQFSPRDDYVIASVQYPQGMRIGRAQKVYAVSVGKKVKLDKPRLLALALLPTHRDMPTVAMPGDGSLLAYVTAARQLRTVFYDGTPGTLVARNVRAVWSLQSLPDFDWWR